MGSEIVEINTLSMSLPDDVMEVPCQTIKEMIDAARTRKAPVVRTMDDPRMLKIGLYVPKTNEWFTVSLSGAVPDRGEYDLSSMEARNKLASSAAKKNWFEEAL